ncbi:hypothetical protein Acr_16g0001240 [Actinidia rufa]|uniref:Uncharacterized protein n=1 Tax=Actinidia rufa TaxID=165716 RepID=A0A7J0FZC3_9ERIC|nr:hypothetical protein Acr_16g0001240 [Actinidia rufa]
MHLCSCLLSRPSASSPLENKAHPMANTSQAPDLEGIHREMHGITKQIRIMNKINARLVKHLTTNNQPPPTAPVSKDANQSHCSHRSGDQNSQSCHGTGHGYSTKSRPHRLASLHSRRRRSPVMLESRSSNRIQDTMSKETWRRGRSPRRDD